MYFIVLWISYVFLCFLTFCFCCYFQWNLWQTLFEALHNNAKTNLFQPLRVKISIFIWTTVRPRLSGHPYPEISIIRPRSRNKSSLCFSLFSHTHTNKQKIAIKAHSKLPQTLGESTSKLARCNNDSRTLIIQTIHSYHIHKSLYTCTSGRPRSLFIKTCHHLSSAGEWTRQLRWAADRMMAIRRAINILAGHGRKSVVGLCPLILMYHTTIIAK